MRILIEFPYNTHYKTKEKFMKQFNCVYATDANNKDAKSHCIFDDGRYNFYLMYYQLDGFFNSVYADYWEFRLADLVGNYFEIHNKVLYIIIPRTWN